MPESDRLGAKIVQWLSSIRGPRSIAIAPVLGVTALLLVSCTYGAWTRGLLPDDGAGFHSG